MSESSGTGFASTQPTTAAGTKPGTGFYITGGLFALLAVVLALVVDVRYIAFAIAGPVVAAVLGGAFLVAGAIHSAVTRLGRGGDDS